MTRYARVIVDVAHSDVDRLFDYILPDGMEAVPGMRLRIPFGHRMREGYLLEIRNETDVPQDKLKQVSAVIDPEPVILPHLVDLARFIARKYHCTMAEALRLMIPAQMRGERVKAREQAILRLAVPRDEALEERIQEAQKRTMQFILQTAHL